MTTGQLHSDRELLLSLTPRRWAPAVFGVVPQGAKRRRPGDIVRVVVSALLVAITARAAHSLALREKRLFDLITDLPSWIRSSTEVAYHLSTIGVAVALIAALLVSKRFVLALLVVISGAIGTAAAFALRNLVDTEQVRATAGMKVSGHVPEYPVVLLASAVTIVLVAGPYLLRPIRRLLFADLAFASGAAMLSVVGLPIDVIGAFALAWGVAAVVHLAFGTPAATPTVGQVSQALEGLGVAVDDLRLAPAQVWGETRYTARAPDDAPVAIDVIGRDAADARLLAKVWRALWYKDSGPTIALTRTQQLEHRAYILMLADRASVPVSEVVIAGVGGSRELAVLVLRDPAGRPLNEVSADEVTDALLDDAWRNLTKLTQARIAHGSLRTENVIVGPDGATAFVDFAYASAVAPPERCSLDAVALLVTTADVVGTERALAAAERALGRDGLAEILPMVEPAALANATRHAVTDVKKLSKALREEGGTRTGTEVAKPVELRRISPTDIAMTAGAILGVYLIIGEFAGIDWAEMFETAEWGWVLVAFIISFGPSFSGSVSLMGAVSAPLPFKPVLAEQFANNFTGLIGGTLANTALVIRFFQRQGQTVAVAASSGILNSLAGGMVQVTLVVIGLIATASDFEAPSDSGLIRLVALLFIGAALLLIVALVIPKLRRRAQAVLKPQWESARDNLRGILSTPRKAVMLFGGNFVSQILFALVIEAALHAYGYSLPLLQLILINSLASVVGGMAPVPGGMGVIEAGLIGGMTAAGIPQEVAVATTFTARACTAYLPPIWGWFALQWLRKNEYV
jgi:uncharacterized membrane protein YbhN (UPF0104 family)